MKPDRFLTEVAMLIARTCYPLFDRETGNQDPISAEQWDQLSEQLNLLYIKNRPKEVRSE